VLPLEGVRVSHRDTPRDLHPIQRSAVVGGALWTVSVGEAARRDLGTLQRTGRVELVPQAP
jgi:hypothetical protein